MIYSKDLIYNNFIYNSIILFAFYFIGVQTVHSQEDVPYISRGDSTEQITEKGPGTLSILFTGKPGKALSYSLIIPGAGQLYNRRYWKAPLVWGGIGVFIYNIDRYSRLEKDFIAEIDRRAMGQTQEFELYSVDALRRFRDITNVNKQYSYLGLGAVYLLSAIEAFVDRHLMEFDVDQDLSMRFQPIPSLNGVGLSMVITFR